MADSDLVYNCCEQYMMHQKALLFGDYASATQIMKCESPRDQKALGRKVSGFDQHIWDERKFDIVVAGNLLKFRQNMTCQRFLIRTADKILVEASPYDRIWGIGLSEEDARLMDPSEWPGQNLLGKALMLVRERIFKKSNLPHP